MTLPSSRNHSLSSRNPRVAPVDAVSRRPPEAAIPIERDEMTAAHGVAQSSATTSSDQVELSPNQGHASNSVEARDQGTQGTSQYPVMMATADECRNPTRHPIQSR
jgi:hypothetical protein